MRADIMRYDSNLQTADIELASGFTPHSSSLASEQDAVVVCRGVTKEFGAGETRIWALRGVDLEVPPGQMTLLVGPSGCGKTTLISIIAGLLNPTAGDVTVLGRELGLLSNGGLVRFRQKHIGF